MLSAVAWNYASPYFQIRLYSATDNDDLREYVFSRNSGGWTPSDQSVMAVALEKMPGPGAPLSAVAAVVLEDQSRTKVYYHPKRKDIAEWDVCAKDHNHAGITKVSTGAMEKRKIEEETRVKIQEEEKRQREVQEQLKAPQGAIVHISDETKAAKLKEFSGCTQGFAWKKEPGGWRCEGGRHTITDTEFAAL